MRRWWILTVVQLLCVVPWVHAAGSSELEFSRALAAYRQGEDERAERLFGAVLQESPRHAGALYYRGLLRLRQGRVEEAANDLAAAYDIRPDLPVASTLAFVYFRAGNAREARRWLARVSEEDPNAGRAALLAATLALRERDWQEAAAQLDRAEKLDPELVGEVAYQRGVLLLRQGRNEEARAALAAAAEWGSEEVAGASRALLEERPVAREPCPGRKRWRLGVWTGFEYDSNLLLQDDPPSRASTRNPASPALVDIDKSDGRYVVGLGGAFSLASTAAVRAEVGYDFYQSVHFRASELDLQGHRVYVASEFLDGALTPGLDGHYAFYLLEDRTYFQELSGSPFLLWDERGQGELEVYYRIRGRDYLGAPFNPSRDGVNHAVGARQSFFLGPRGERFDLWYQYDREDPKSNRSGREFERQSNTVGASLAWPFPGALSVELGYWYRNDDYLNESTRGRRFSISGETRTSSATERNDDVHTLVASATRPLYGPVWLTVAYWGQIDDSNLATFDYDRHIVSVTLGASF
ncbi:MAG: hypothetical protein KatS3mg076_0109 [Candidatus Binatia bacterium]|nr:MAG: hypothetical protein KatS3mg076_0109 [Candidatus Binatia bacterium]